MYSIYKHILIPEQLQVISIQSNRILSVEEQRNEIVLYYVVDKENCNNYNYEILVLGTGHQTENNIKDLDWNFVGTVKMEDGSLMFHVFCREVDGSLNEI